MAVNTLQMVDIIEVMENFLDKARPPEHIRPQMDVSYNIEGQSVIIYEVRPRWDRPEQKAEHAVAKATYVKTTDCWKVYWMRGNLKWNPYGPKSTVQTLREFTEVVNKDSHGCFWG